MNITDYIEECRKQRHDLSFAFLAERCPASEEAPYRIKPCSPIAPDENCVLILAGTGGRNVNLRGYNSILKKTDNFVKQNIDSSIVPVRTCVAICDFGKRHLDNIARKGAYFEAWWPQHIAALKHDIPENCIEETFNPLYIKDIFDNTILPRITASDGNNRLPLRQARQNIRHLNIVAHCHGAYVAVQLEKLMDKKVYQMMVGCYKEEYADILRDVDGARITAWWTRAADITPANGNKGVGVRKILDYYHLDKENAIAFGDGTNDIEMLEAVGTGVAMGNATDDVKAVADAICGHVAEDGIYHYCKEQGLI